MIADPNKKTTRPSHVACKCVIQNSLTRCIVVRPRSSLNPSLKSAVSACADNIRNAQYRKRGKGPLGVHRSNAEMLRTIFVCRSRVIAKHGIRGPHITCTWWLKIAALIGKPRDCKTCVTRACLLACVAENLPHSLRINIHGCELPNLNE
jgi:hypothetical protein